MEQFNKEWNMAALFRTSGFWCTACSLTSGA